MTWKKGYITRQAQRLTAGEINRRRFVMSALSAGVTLPTAMSLASKAQGATPRKGGLFRYGTAFGAAGDTLDPARSDNHMTAAIALTRGNTLTEVENTGKLVPALAEHIEPANGARTWVVDLRAGVEFHDGRTLCADDVLATMRHHMRAGTRSAMRGLLSQIADVRTDGDSRVIFELTAPNADFAWALSDDHLVILPGEDGAIDPLSPVGTGAYVLDHFEPGVRARFTRNPNYWRADRAHFDAVEMIPILDATMRQNALMNGEVDFIDNVDPRTVALLNRVPTVEILETAGRQHYTFPMRLDVEPFGNYDLRMALKHAIRRQELVDKILLGHGSPGNDLPVRTAPGGGVPVHEFDPERAAAHYRKSGHSGPVRLTVSDAAFPGAVDAAQLIAASAAEAGITLEVVRAPEAGYWSEVWNRAGWCAAYSDGRPVQDLTYATGYSAEAAWNDTAWRGTEAAQRFEGLVAQARSETDDTRRESLYGDAQRLLQDDGGAIVAMWANYIHAHAKTLAHEEAVGTNKRADGARVAERWWFA